MLLLSIPLNKLPCFPAFNLPPLPAEHKGLEETTAQLKRSERKFVTINNNLGINMFKASVQDVVHKKENLVVSLVSATTSLAMIFLGARGVTSWQINELLRYRQFYYFFLDLYSFLILASSA